MDHLLQKTIHEEFVNNNINNSIKIINDISMNSGVHIYKSNNNYTSKYRGQLNFNFDNSNALFWNKDIKLNIKVNGFDIYEYLNFKNLNLNNKYNNIFLNNDCVVNVEEKSFIFNNISRECNLILFVKKYDYIEWSFEVLNNNSIDYNINFQIDYPYIIKLFSNQMIKMKNDFSLLSSTNQYVNKKLNNNENNKNNENNQNNGNNGNNGNNNENNDNDNYDKDKFNKVLIESNIKSKKIKQLNIRLNKLNNDYLNKYLDNKKLLLKIKEIKKKNDKNVFKKRIKNFDNEYYRITELKKNNEKINNKNNIINKMKKTILKLKKKNNKYKENEKQLKFLLNTLKIKI